jgi:alkanesulfonate monooxygenase SsuD/methylene tetrahydromethanopterin reductase-like flavin-dependent oxidoreductase (luciferase family)
VLLSYNTCIADSDAEAREQLSAGLRYFHGFLMKPIRKAQNRVIESSKFFADAQHGERFSKRLATLNQRSIEEMIEAGSVLCGSPETVVRQMRRIRDALGNGWFNLNFKIGNIPDAVVRHGMELFRDRVLPEASTF